MAGFAAHPGTAGGAGTAPSIADPETTHASSTSNESAEGNDVSEILDGILDDPIVDESGGDTAAGPGEESPDTEAETTEESEPENELPVETEGEEDEAADAETSDEKVDEPKATFSKYKTVFKEHPELRDIVGNAAAVQREFGSIREALEVGKLVPTKADAEELHGAAQTLDAINESLDSTEPAAVADLLGGIRAESPERLRRLVSGVLSMADLATLVPEAMPAIRKDAVAFTLRNYARMHANDDRLEDEVAAVQLTLRALGLPAEGPSDAAPGTAGETPRERQLREENERLRKVEDDGRLRQREAYVASLDADVRSSLGEMIGKRIDVYGKRDQKERDRMVAEGVEKVLGDLTKDPNVVRHQRRINQAVGTWDKGHADQIATLYRDYGKRLVNDAVTGIVKEYGTRASKTTTETRARAETRASATREATGAGRAPAGKTPPKLDRSASVRDVFDSVL